MIERESNPRLENWKLPILCYLFLTKPVWFWALNNSDIHNPITSLWLYHDRLHHDLEPGSDFLKYLLTPILNRFLGTLFSISVISQKSSTFCLRRMQKKFVTSRLENCDSLLSGSPIKSPKCLQLICNAAAHLLTKISIKDHISPVSSTLYWIAVKYRIE